MRELFFIKLFVTNIKRDDPKWLHIKNANIDATSSINFEALINLIDREKVFSYNVLRIPIYTTLPASKSHIHLLLLMNARIIKS